MSKYKYIWILLACSIFVVPNDICAYNSITFENLTIDNGLSQATVEAVVQDSKGYIWIGTNDGLNRYNGSYIERNFKSDKQSTNSIISSYIMNLVEDKYHAIIFDRFDQVVDEHSEVKGGS